MDVESLSGAIGDAESHANLGLLTRSKGRLSIPRRLLTRVLWPLLREQIDFNRRLVEALRAVSDRMTFLRQSNDNFEGAFDNVDQAIIDAHKRMVLLDEKLELIQRQSFFRYEQAVGSLQRELADAMMMFETASSDSSEALRETAEEVRGLQQRIELGIQSIQQRIELGIQSNRDEIEFGLTDARYRLGELDLFLGEVKRALPHPPRMEELAALPDALASIYPSFEEAHRGPESLIKERAKAYLADVEGVGALGPILDLGSGRCEWLTVLQEAGINAYGVEINEQYVERGIAQGLDVRRGDALDHLRGLPESKLGAITAFHLAEHLPTEVLIELLDLSLRALQPGGLLILETPDPDNLIVGASSFYLDPTHIHPLPPPLLSFLVGARGFTHVKVREMKRERPVQAKLTRDAPWSTDIEEIWEYISSRIAGPEDYAVLGRRA